MKMRNVVVGVLRRQARRQVLTRTLLSGALLVILLPGYFGPPKETAASFSFTAVGDFGASTDTDAVLGAISASGATFTLALGDMSYGALQPESAWCNYVKSHVGSAFPFELLAGNHDSGRNLSEGNINNFAACLPNRVGSFTGTYAKEYYFDYPASTPLARFILISPQIDFASGGYYSYAAGTSHYNWVRNAIDSARSANIPWVVVGMHKICLGTGGHTCEVEQALFNLLISKRVDLILQAHDHNYQRSKQIALNAGCTSVVAGTYNASCIADDGADNAYSKENGSVIIINGTGGRSLYEVSSADPENGYFARWMGANLNPTFGVTQISVSSTQITAEFVRASGGTFTDRFTISRPIALDTFSRSVTNGWGSADTGGQYSGTGSSAYRVNGSQGLISVAVGQRLQATLAAVNAQDVDIRVRVKTDKAPAGAPSEIALLIRNRPGIGHYRARLAFAPGGSLTVMGQKFVASTNSTQGIGAAVTVPGVSYQAGGFIWLRAQVSGVNPTTVRIKAWAAGQTEPGNWQYVGTDSQSVLQTAGNVALLARLPADSTAAPTLFVFDDYAVARP
jgi:hypothetical protein